MYVVKVTITPEQEERYSAPFWVAKEAIPYLQETENMYFKYFEDRFHCTRAGYWN